MERRRQRRAHADGGTDDGIAGAPSSFDPRDRGLRHTIGFALGPLAFAFLLLAPAPDGLPPEAQAVAASTAWVAVWWVTEAIPIPATSLLPVVLYPLTGARTVAETTPSYAHPVIFLFLGGFFLAVAMQRWNLHRRIALRIVVAVGTRPTRLIAGFTLATAFLSMWVSNTATVMMMVPIAVAVVGQTALPGDGESVDNPFGLALMLCIAYGASVGGVATLIGSPPNVIFAGQARELVGVDVSFLDWMYYGVPVAALGLIAVYVWVVHVSVRPDAEDIQTSTAEIEREIQALGPTSTQERLVLLVFAGMAAGWIGSGALDNAGVLTVPADVDSVVAILGALALFSIPTYDDGERTFLLDWRHAVRIPWGVVLLFGGGLAIASGFSETGLASYIGGLLTGLAGLEVAVVVIAVVALTITLTEVTSNTATTAMLMPVLAGVAVGVGVHPVGLMIAAATAASFAFMLPVATPPNAVVFGSGYVSIPQMARTGVGLNVVGVVLISLVALVWLPFAWDITLTEVPEHVVDALG